MRSFAYAQIDSNSNIPVFLFFNSMLDDPGLEDIEGRSMDAKFRCGLYGKFKRPSVG